MEGTKLKPTVKRNPERFIMKIVVIGGRGLIGSKVATKLSAQGHDVIAASRRSGVDSLTGEGLANAVAGADVAGRRRRFALVRR